MEPDSADFERWYRREHPRLLGALVALSGDPHLAAEVTDEAFTRALARWSTVGRMDAPAGWTYRVALNALRRTHRRRGSERRALQVVGSRAGGSGGDGDPTGHPEVWDAVRALPPRQREAVVLRYVADLPEAAIAEALGVSRGTVASNLSDARRALAAFLDEEPAGDGDEPRPTPVGGDRSNSSPSNPAPSNPAPSNPAPSNQAPSNQGGSTSAPSDAGPPRRSSPESASSERSTPSGPSARSNPEVAS